MNSPCPLCRSHHRAVHRSSDEQAGWKAAGVNPVRVATALNAALNVLQAQAQFEGPRRKVSIRLAEHDGLIYLDLADEFWRCIEIGAHGWRIARGPFGQVPPQRRHAVTSAPSLGRIN